MIYRPALAVLLFTMGIIASPMPNSASLAIAQEMEPATHTRSRIPRPAREMDQGDARQMQHEFAQCVYSNHSDLADKLLRSSDWGAIAYGVFGHRAEDFSGVFSMPRCIESAMQVGSRVRMTIQPDQLRRLLAEQAYLASHVSPPTISDGDPEFLQSCFMASGFGSNSRTMGRIADCIVFSDPSLADRLLRTPPASEHERAAAQDLVPVLGACLPEGSEVQVSVATIRALAADGLWARTAYSTRENAGEYSWQAPEHQAAQPTEHSEDEQ